MELEGPFYINGVPDESVESISIGVTEEHIGCITPGSREWKKPIGKLCVIGVIRCKGLNFSDEKEDTLGFFVDGVHRRLNVFGFNQCGGWDLENDAYSFLAFGKASDYPWIPKSAYPDLGDRKPTYYYINGRREEAIEEFSYTRSRHTDKFFIALTGQWKNVTSRELCAGYIYSKASIPEFHNDSHPLLKIDVQFIDEQGRIVGTRLHDTIIADFSETFTEGRGKTFNYSFVCSSPTIHGSNSNL